MHWTLQLVDVVFWQSDGACQMRLLLQVPKGTRGAPKVDSRFEVRKPKTHHFEHPVCTHKPLGNDDAVLREQAHRGNAVTHVTAHRACVAPRRV